MSGYVDNEGATRKALTADGWYTNLGDVVFRLKSPIDPSSYGVVWHLRC